MFKKIALATALIAGLGNAYAYQAEVGGTVAYVDPDHGSGSAGFALDGTYYFNPVQIKDSPLNEAAFLNRASNVNADVSYYDYDLFDLTTYNVGLEYFVPNSDFYVSGKIGQTFLDSDLRDNDTLQYSAEVGYLPIPGLLLAVGLLGYDNDYDDGVDPTIRAKYVTKIGSYDMNFEGGASFGDIDAYNVGADLYLDKTLSLGVGYSGSDLEGNDEDVFSIRAKKFFTQQVSLEGNIGFGDDANTYGVRAAYRF